MAGDIFIENAYADGKTLWKQNCKGFNSKVLF
jgi:hypothetical protein